MLKMDEVNKIRKAYFIYGYSINKIAKQFNRSWETIHRIVSMEQEELLNRGKRPNRKGSVTTPEVKEAVEKYIQEEIEKSVRKKQRYTAKKIYDELKAKGIYKGSRRTMDHLIKTLREKHNQTKKTSYLPLDFELGSSLQIDHGETDLFINEERCRGYLFIASVPGYSLRYCQIFPIKAQEAWGEFHERAYHFFGGCFDKNVYDNDKVLVSQIKGKERKQTHFSYFLEEHFGFASHFCNVASGNEKGCVENGVGYCRRNFLAGTPSFQDWNQVNTHLEQSCHEDIIKGVHYKTHQPLHVIFASLKQKLAPLPPRKMWSKSLDCRVDSCQLIQVDRHTYSVPEKFVGTYVRVELGTFQLKVFKENDLIALHERQYGASDSLKLDHYLDQLKYKSAALWDCKATKNHQFDPIYLEFNQRLLERLPRNKANKEFIKTLLLERQYNQKDLLKSIQIALKFGALDHLAIEYILKQQQSNQLTCHEKELEKKLKEEHIYSWDFNLSAYEELCNEVAYD